MRKVIKVHKLLYNLWTFRWCILGCLKICMYTQKALKKILFFENSRFLKNPNFFPVPFVRTYFMKYQNVKYSQFEVYQRILAIWTRIIVLHHIRHIFGEFCQKKMNFLGGCVPFVLRYFFHKINSGTSQMSLENSSNWT